MKQYRIIAPPSKAEIFYNEHKPATYSSAVLAAGLGIIYLAKGRHVSQLAKSNAKFIYGAVREGGRARAREKKRGGIILWDGWCAGR